MRNTGSTAANEGPLALDLFIFVSKRLQPAAAAMICLMLIHLLSPEKPKPVVSSTAVHGLITQH